MPHLTCFRLQFFPYWGLGLALVFAHHFTFDLHNAERKLIFPFGNPPSPQGGEGAGGEAQRNRTPIDVELAPIRAQIRQSVAVRQDLIGVGLVDFNQVHIGQFPMRLIQQARDGFGWGDEKVLTYQSTYADKSILGSAANRALIRSAARNSMAANRANVIIVLLLVFA